MNVSIRPVKIEDAKAIAGLSLQLGYTISEPDTVLNIELLDKSSQDAVYVAVREETVIGWIHVFYCIKIESLPFCEIAGLVTDETVRGQGVGKMLVGQAMKWADDKYCNTLVVRTNVVRTQAHRFYESCGFVLKKQQNVYIMSNISSS